MVPQINVGPFGLRKQQVSEFGALFIFVVCPRCHFCSLAAGQPCLAPLNHGAPSACSCACSAGGGLQLCQANDCLGQCDWLRREISQLAELCLLLAVAYPPPPLPRLGLCSFAFVGTPSTPRDLSRVPARVSAEYLERLGPKAGCVARVSFQVERCAGRVQWEGGVAPVCRIPMYPSTARRRLARAPPWSSRRGPLASCATSQARYGRTGRKDRRRAGSAQHAAFDGGT